MHPDWPRIENMVTITATAGALVGLWALGAGGWAFWCLLFLFNLNGTEDSRSCDCEEDKKS